MSSPLSFAKDYHLLHLTNNSFFVARNHICCGGKYGFVFKQVIQLQRSKFGSSHFLRTSSQENSKQMMS